MTATTGVAMVIVMTFDGVSDSAYDDDSGGGGDDDFGGPVFGKWW